MLGPLSTGQLPLLVSWMHESKGVLCSKEEGTENELKKRTGLQRGSKGWRGNGPSNEGGGVEDKLQQAERSQAMGLEAEVTVAEGVDLLPVERPRAQNLPRCALKASLA